MMICVEAESVALAALSASAFLSQSAPTSEEKMFLSPERFPHLFPPVEVSGDDRRPRCRGRGGAVQLVKSTSKSGRTSMKIKSNVRAGIIVVC
jgi:hypothetical protein